MIVLLYYHAKLTLHVYDYYSIQKKSDKDLGLAVIERWTHAFLGNYYDRSNDRTTLEEVMVLPFANKQVLGAQIGTKDDTSARKFKDFTLSDFFGKKGGGVVWPEKSTTTHPLASEKPEILKIETRSIESQADSLPRELVHGGRDNRKVPSPLPRRRNVATTDAKASSRASHSTQVHSEKSFFFLTCLLLVAVLVASTLESKFSRKRISAHSRTDV